MPAGLVIAFFLKPVSAHLAARQERSPFQHLAHTVVEPRYRLAFLVTMLLPTGGFMLMPFGTAYIVGNVGLSLHDLPVIYLVTGLAAAFAGPLIGKASDSFGKFQTFCFGTILTLVMVAIWTNLGHAPLAIVILVNVVLFISIFSRIIPSQALVSAIPELTRRGAFNAISASLQQFAGGISASIAGAVIAVAPDGSLRHFNWLGYIVMAVALLSLVMMYFVHKQVPEPAPR